MPFDLILKNVQSCLNQPLNLKNASPSSLYSLVQDVPFFSPVVGRAALQRTHSILIQKLSSLGRS